jgi:hypothetical protein
VHTEAVADINGDLPAFDTSTMGVLHGKTSNIVQMVQQFFDLPDQTSTPAPQQGSPKGDLQATDTKHLCGFQRLVRNR